MIKHYKNTTFGILLLLFCILKATTLSSQNVSIIGPDEAFIDESKSYYLDDPSGEIDHIVGWYPGGTIVVGGGASTTADIIWDFADEFNSVEVEYVDNNGDTQYAYLGVVVAYIPEDPIFSIINGVPTLQRSSSGPETGITWYWQTSDSGEDTTYNSEDNNQIYPLPLSSGTYYIRAQNTNGDWCFASGSVYVSIVQSVYMNTITSKSYDINETLKASSKAYFNELGKSIQNQTVDIKNNRTWVSSTLYDTQGRPALSTLSAPINNLGGTFDYKSDFIGTNYDIDDFEGIDNGVDKTLNPSPASSSSNRLGWYYSPSNDDTFEAGNSYQDVTSRPYSRTIYSELNPGAVLKTIGGNKTDTDNDGDVDDDDTWLQGYTFSMPAGNELTQAGAFNDPTYAVSDTRKIMKTVSRDVHGYEAVVFTDFDGKTLAAARVGASVSREVTITIREQGFVDVHVPVGTEGFAIDNPVSGITTEVFDLRTETLVTETTTTLDPGFYRISITNLDSYDPQTPITITCNENYYDYSLNEYDEAGRLTASYQPLNKLKTEYQYNGLGQLTYTKSPDEGEAWFIYRKDGQIRFSQNSKQVLAGEFSYTNYDDLGRPIESGVAVGVFDDDLDPDSSTFTLTSKREQQFTVYDDQEIPTNQEIPIKTFTQAIDDLNLTTQEEEAYQARFLAGNVAVTYTKAPETTTTWYSYDIYGRVEWIVQYINDLGAKTIDYKYDPITGAVTEVDFQKNNIDEHFVHHYTYDPIDNSLIKVETSTTGLANSFTTHANYKYYETGALKRVELAPLNNTGAALQGIDYVYNLNGQLKSINHPSLTAGKDPGGDNNDLFGMQIDYHSHDYARTERTNINTETYGKDQFNGNIKGIRWNNKAFGDAEETFSYYYNQNNWLTDAIYGEYADTPGDGLKINIFDKDQYIAVNKDLIATNSITFAHGFQAKPDANTAVTAKIQTGALSDFQSGDYNVFDITYDANGNIRTLNRNKNDNGGNNTMDYLNYTYKDDKPNQLLRVDDAAGTIPDADDIEDQDGNNYEYNAIGQLTKNVAEDIEYIYNASGLVTEIKKDNVSLVKFFYNDKGHRVKKEAYKTDNSGLDYTEHYVRDAAGTSLAIYRDGVVKEHTIYGASRLGVYTRDLTGTGGSSVYQLTDHLGNVRAVVERSGSTAVAIVNTDYYPFGMPMPNRENGKNSYRYAYQGQEKDQETGKEAFELRLWDSRIGRWLTTDPKGVHHSPYLGMANNPISAIDPDGGSPFWIDNGDGTWTAEAGDSAWTLAEDAGISYDQALDIMASQGYGTYVGGGILKSDVDPGHLVKVFEVQQLDAVTITAASINHPYKIDQFFSYSGWDIGGGVKGWSSFLNKGKPGAEAIAGRFTLNAMVTFDGSNYSLRTEGFVSTDNHPSNKFNGWLNIKYTSDKSLRLATESLPFSAIGSHYLLSGTSYLGGQIMLLPKDPNSLSSLGVSLSVHRRTPLGGIGAGLQVDLLKDIKN
ncbi:MAG: RHS repeat-associated core domain-containing protein [Algibacter sp.]